MKYEVENAAEFLAKLLRIGCGKTATRKQVESFRVKMVELLFDHFQHHWFPQKPFKGSGYRCLRINHNKMDPILAKAAVDSGYDISSLGKIFPNEFTMWIDPREVSYRIGENGSICVLTDADSSEESSGAESDPEVVQEKIKNVTTTTSSSFDNGSYLQHQQNYKIIGHENSYSHPFPTPPSSPQTIQGYHHHHNHPRHNGLRHHNLTNSSCGKDLNSYWNVFNSAVSGDGRHNSTAMFNLEQLATFVSS